MASCPVCSTRISFWAMLFAFCPVWVTCPNCRSRLVGDLFVGTVAIVAGLVGLICGYATVYAVRAYGLSFESTVAALPVLMVALVLPNVFVALRWGRFSVRD